MGLKALSLFTGVGGLDFGFEAAEFETAVALDIDPICCRTIRLNRHWPVLEGDLAELSPATILDTAGLRPGDADVLLGGPPCQPFSKSGYWATGDAKRLNDPRANTLTQYFDVLSATLPATFLLENVPGLNYRGKNEGIEVICKAVRLINEKHGTNYTLSISSLNAANYGVPQLRERVFVIGSRDGKKFRFPEPTHSLPAQAEGLALLEPFRTTWDAIGDLPAEPNDEDLKMSGKWADLLATIPEGQNYLWHTPRGGGLPLFGWRRRYWSFLLKLSKALPSWTIQAQPGPATGPFHWRNRKLSVTELSRLQTFPDGLVFDCRRAEAQRLIGNAVPSALAEMLAREMAHQLLGREQYATPLTLIPPKRPDVPEPEPLAEVPRKFLALVGGDVEHPGTGRGRRALARELSLVG